MDVSKITIGDVSKEWLEMKRLTVKQSTFSKYYCIVERQIIPELGGILLKDVTSSAINSFTRRKLEREDSDGEAKKGLGNKTVRDINVILKSIIRYAEREYGTGHIAQNTVLPRTKRESIETLTSEEIRRIVNYLHTREKDPRCTGLLLCLYSGMRLGEICALRWEDIDLDDRVIAVNHTLQRIPIPDENSIQKTRIIIDVPKTSTSMRRIPISSQIYPLLEAQRAENKESFFLTNSEKFMEPRNYQYFFKRVLRKSEVRNVNFHILRHTFATKCVEAGMDVKTLSEILGHSNISITLDYYVHSSMESKKRQIDMLKL